MTFHFLHVFTTASIHCEVWEPASDNLFQPTWFNYGKLLSDGVTAEKGVIKILWKPSAI